jgi:hypothetical protein
MVFRASSLDKSVSKIEAQHATTSMFSINKSFNSVTVGNLLNELERKKIKKATKNLDSSEMALQSRNNILNGAVSLDLLACIQHCLYSVFLNQK